MGLVKEQQLLKKLESNKNIKAIKVVTTNTNFEKRFEGSIALFFRTLKNSMHSYGGITNREFFRNLSGAYFSLEETERLEIIILYDETKTVLPPLQVKVRLQKLLGLGIEVEFGNYNQYESRIKEMLGIERRSQTFGDFYFKDKK